MIIKPNAIYLDENGDEIPNPGPCPENATFEQWVTWSRAVYAWRDKITDVANRAFEHQFRRALRRKP